MRALRPHDSSHSEKRSRETISRLTHKESERNNRDLSFLPSPSSSSVYSSCVTDNRSILPSFLPHVLCSPRRTNPQLKNRILIPPSMSKSVALSALSLQVEPGELLSLCGAIFGFVLSRSSSPGSLGLVRLQQLRSSAMLLLTHLPLYSSARAHHQGAMNKVWTPTAVATDYFSNHLSRRNPFFPFRKKKNKTINT